MFRKNEKMINKTIDIYEEDKEWLYKFAELHNLLTTESAIHKLIEIHKAWNT